MLSAAAAIAAARAGWLSVGSTVLGWAGVVGAGGTAGSEGLGLGGVGVALTGGIWPGVGAGRGAGVAG